MWAIDMLDSGMSTAMLLEINVRPNIGTFVDYILIESI